MCISRTNHGQRTSHDFMCRLAYSSLSIHKAPGDFRQQAICVGLQLRRAAPYGLAEHGQSGGCNPEVSIPCKNSEEGGYSRACQYASCYA